MFPVSSRFLEVIGGSHRVVVRATLFTQRLVGLDPFSQATGIDLPILSGNVKMQSTSDVKTTLDLTVPGDYWDVVQPYSGEVFIERGVDFGDGTAELIPLGYFRIDDAKQDDAPFGPVTITGSDRIASLQQNRVLYPYQVPDGTTHRTIFERLVNGRLTPASDLNSAGYAALLFTSIPITFLGYDPDRITVNGGQVVNDSTYEFLAQLADDQGCVLRFDESGSLVVDVRDVDPTTAPIYVVGPGATGNLVKASRSTTREGVYNIVVAHGSDVAFPTGYQLSYLTDPNSPIRWDGPFGPAPRYYASPLLRDANAAASAAASVLSRYTGLPQTQGLWIVPNPALRPNDMLAASITGLAERHVIDELSIPLTGDETVSITTKTTNSSVDPDEPSTPPPDEGGSQVTQAQRDQEKAFEITSTAENSTLQWWTAYDYIENIGDGRGLTGGIVGFTSATADMEDMVRNYYVTAKPTAALASFLTGLATCTAQGEGDPGATNAANTNLGAPFIAAWKDAGKNDATMRKAQRDYREANYWAPAYQAAIADGLGPLGQAIYYDTMVNHGPGTPGSGDGSFDDIRSQTTGGGGSGATLGQTANSGSTSSSSTDKMTASRFTAGATGTVTQGHARVSVTAGTSKMKMLVYADGAGPAPAALLATSDEVTVSNTTEQNLTFPFSGAQQYGVTSGMPYWVALAWKDPGSGNVVISRAGTASARVESSGWAYPAMPNPFGTATAQSGPADAYLDIAVAGGGSSNQTAWLTDFLAKRSTVLTAWGDNPPDGRIKMFTDLLATGNLTLTCPFSWSVYGDAFQIAAEPDPHNEGAPSTGGNNPGFTSVGEALNIGPGDTGLNHVNIGIGFAPDNRFGSAAIHKDFDQALIANDFSEPGYYELNTNGEIVFTVPLDGGRTSKNTKYPRVEHRGLNPDGSKQSFAKGKRAYIKCRLRVPSLPPNKPEVVGLQFHDANDDVAMIHIHDGLVRAKIKGEYVGTLQTGWDRTQMTDAMIEVMPDGTVNFYWGSLTTPALVNTQWRSTNFSGWYAKGGAYAQSWAYAPGNTSETRDGSGPTDDLGDGPIVVVWDPLGFEIWQDGWAKPARLSTGTPGGGTGGSGSGGSTPPPSSDDGVQAAVTQSWGPVIAGDEFAYSGAPDPAKWSMYDGPGHDGNGIRSPSAFSVGNGVLTCYGDNVNGGTTGGMAFKRETKYVRIEWRVRAYSVNPSGKGNRYHPVLIMWPTSDRWPQDGEYDFYEVDCDTGKYEHYEHIPGNDGSAQEYDSFALDIQNWHNVAFEWSKTGIRGFVDGKQVWEYKGSYILAPGTMHPTFQMDNFFGSNMEPAKFEAMWMRIYASPS